MQNNKIKHYFEKIKEAHSVYTKVSFDKQRKILDAFDWVFIELEKLGVKKTISESLLIWGKEFTDSFIVPVAAPTNLIGDTSLSQQNQSSKPLSLNQQPNQQLNQQSNQQLNQQSIEPSSNEMIFDGKVRWSTEKEVREVALAEKYNALVYKSREAVDPKKVSIEVLLEEKVVDKDN